MSNKYTAPTRARTRVAERVLAIVQLWSKLSKRTCTWQEARDIAETSVPLDALSVAIARGYEQYKPSSLAYFRRMALDMETEHHKRITEDRRKQQGSEGFVSAAELTKRQLPRRRHSRPQDRTSPATQRATTSRPSAETATQPDRRSSSPAASLPEHPS